MCVYVCVSAPPSTKRSCEKKGLWEEQVARFRGKEPNPEAVIGGHVVRIDEAEEPSDILWEHIDTSIFHRFVIVWRVDMYFQTALFLGKSIAVFSKPHIHFRRCDMIRRPFLLVGVLRLDWRCIDTSMLQKGSKNRRGSRESTVGIVEAW